MTKTRSAQLVVISDLHCGSKLGLMPPKFELDDGDLVTPNKMQRQMWDFWEGELWPLVDKRAENRKTVVVVNGDGIENKHHETTQIWSLDPLEHIAAAVEVLKPIATKYPIFVTRGTPAHVLPAAAADEAIAREIGATKPKGELRRVRSSYNLNLNLEGVLFQIAHHGPNTGNRVHTYGNALRGYVRDIAIDAWARKLRHPDCVIRSHVHKKVKETLDDYGHTYYGIITPAFQWKTEFAHKIASKDDLADVGGTIISIDGGKITDIEFKLLTLSQSDTVTVA